MASPVEKSQPYQNLELSFDAHLSEQAQQRTYCFFKRAIDLVLVVTTAPLTLSIIAILALLLHLQGTKPFYHQPRVGLNGKAFTFWKLRTMIPDADQRLEDYLARNPAARIEWDETQKLKNDPRITRLGRILRRTSADELPQLWNVLIGDMSLVGPRPMLPEQQVLYPGRAYFQMRPGITGLWQTSSRNESSFSSRAAFDTHYAHIMSFSVDITILLKTIGVVIRGTGY